MADGFLDRLRQAAASARDAEDAFRRGYAERVRVLERERVFAHRRSGLLEAVAAAVAGAADADEAARRGRDALAQKTGLSGANEAHKVILDRFSPVTEAIDEALNCEGEPDHDAVLARLAEFEDWFAARSGQPFLALFDVYAQETPVVDF
ncbi:hypothetical protein NK718_03470 [Alsobacter sp. SYSU M60028]|uniref:Uncharacterized protein n=1 Tax=Alsobacter ponti TaxID=2962936 RepID=A0ABT1L7U1_9HYPH|nr:hypothetical protein [Alsobacter ponti]MCP8937562.1 hypothetical protein [Alsobacter ponti]